MRVHRNAQHDTLAVYADHWRRGTASTRRAHLQAAARFWAAMDVALHGQAVPPILSQNGHRFDLYWSLAGGGLFWFQSSSATWNVWPHGKPIQSYALDEGLALLQAGTLRIQPVEPAWTGLRGELRRDDQGCWRFHASALR